MSGHSSADDTRPLRHLGQSRRDRSFVVPTISTIATGSKFPEVMEKRLHRRYHRQIPALHLRAAHWFRQHNHFDEAIRHALAAKDYSAVAEIVESQAPDLLHVGDLSRLMNWLDALPPDIVDSLPWLSVDLAWVYLLIGRLNNIEPLDYRLASFHCDLS